MHTTDLSAGALAKADVPLSPQERLREIAAILAAGVLRLKTRPVSPPPGRPAASGTQTGGSPAQAGSPESGTSGREGTAEKLSESPRNCLDEFARPRTHVPAV